MSGPPCQGPAPPGPSAWRPERFIVGFVDRLRQRLLDAGAAEAKNGADRTPDARLLVGYRGHLFTVDCDFGVVAHEESIAAVGCADGMLLSALYVLRRQAARDPQRALLTALGAAARFNQHVRPPFTLVHT